MRLNPSHPRFGPTQTPTLEAKTSYNLNVNYLNAEPTMDLPPPPKLDSRGPTLATMHEIENILRSADEALSLNEIKRRMNAKAVRHDTVRMAIEDFKRRSWVVEGEKGVVWTLNTNPRLWKKGQRL